MFVICQRVDSKYFVLSKPWPAFTLPPIDDLYQINQHHRPAQNLVRRRSYSQKRSRLEKLERDEHKMAIVARQKDAPRFMSKDRQIQSERDRQSGRYM